MGCSKNEVWVPVCVCVHVHLLILLLITTDWHQTQLPPWFVSLPPPSSNTHTPLPPAKRPAVTRIISQQQLEEDNLVCTRRRLQTAIAETERRCPPPPPPPTPLRLSLPLSALSIGLQQLSVRYCMSPGTARTQPEKRQCVLFIHQHSCHTLTRLASQQREHRWLQDGHKERWWSLQHVHFM